MSGSPSASEYILDNFESADRVAVLLRNRDRDEVIQRIGTADTIAGRDFQEWLQSKNQSGFDVYIGMNALREGAYSRTKQDIQTIRHVYLDIDYEGEMALAAIQKSEKVPKPNYVLNTSPGKYQVVWKMEHATPEEAESLQQAMAEQFGADPAATDSTRVLRLPGFVNRKYKKNSAFRWKSIPPPFIIRETSRLIRTPPIRVAMLNKLPVRRATMIESLNPNVTGLTPSGLSLAVTTLKQSPNESPTTAPTTSKTPNITPA